MSLGRCGFVALLGLTAASSALAQSRTGADKVTDIGSRRELFVDRHLIESMKGVRLVLHEPRRAEIVLKLDAPWEGPTCAYFTVFQDGPLYRMYYRGRSVGSDEITCYAESKDGIHWTKPELGLIEYEGSTKNNIILKGPGRKGTHNFTPFKDTRPGVPSDQQYKALGGGPLYAYTSADAIRWRLLAEQPVLTKGAFDSQNLAFWDPNKKRYVAYYRIFLNKIRAVATAESDDFLKWDEARPIDLGKAAEEHFYTNATLSYFRAPHYYFAFPSRFQPQRKRLADHPVAGISDAVFLTSRDGVRFERTFAEALVRPGPDPKNWGDRSNMVAWGLVPTGPDEMSIYFTQHYRQPTNHLRRGVFRLDGIASASGGAAGGELLTRPLRFTGKRLLLNYATSAAGSIQVELQDAAGKPLPGFSLTDARELFGDSLSEACAWKAGADVGAIAGTAVRLRFVLKDADLFSYRFD
jgi:hypothetical protein